MKKILVIDDDEATLEIMAIMLENSGYEAITNSRIINIEEIIAINPDLIIIDLQLPERMGDEICLELKSKPETHGIPVILYSIAYNVASIAHHCKADAFLAKPFDIYHFMDLIRRLAA